LPGLDPPSSGPPPHCDIVVDKHGHDRSAGTQAAPLRTSNRAIHRLRAGETVCFHTGTYRTTRGLAIEAPNAIVRSYPGEHATLLGSLRIERPATGTTVESLTLDGKNPKGYFNPIIYADGAVLRDNEITNEHTTNCVHLARYYNAPPPRGVVIEDNNIHDCGVLPAQNHEHGIYVAASRDLTIRNNLIWNNADRGIQLYTDVKDTQIYGNVINNNGVGIIISGADGLTTSNTLIQHNLITYSNVRHNVESWFGPGTSPGTNNVVRDNCIHGAQGWYAGSDDSGMGDQEGFTATDNVNADPGYENAPAGDFKMSPDSPCAGIFADGEGPPSVRGG
jgi:parallel beta-helix repeat protein